MKNEITRLTAVKALIRIASSELKIDLRIILADSLPILAGFLRKNQRALKLSSLALLDILVRLFFYLSIVLIKDFGKLNLVEIAYGDKKI